MNHSPTMTGTLRLLEDLQRVNHQHALGLAHAAGCIVNVHLHDALTETSELRIRHATDLRQLIAGDVTGREPQSSTTTQQPWWLRIEQSIASDDIARICAEWQSSEHRLAATYQSALDCLPDGATRALLCRQREESQQHLLKTWQTAQLPSDPESLHSNRETPKSLS